MREIKKKKMYIVHLRKTIGDCFEDKSGICIIKTETEKGTNRRWRPRWKYSLDSGVYLVVHKKRFKFIFKCNDYKTPHRPLFCGRVTGKFAKLFFHLLC